MNFVYARAVVECVTTSAMFTRNVASVIRHNMLWLNYCFVTRINLTRILRTNYRALKTSLLPFRELQFILSFTTFSTKQNDLLSAAMRYRLAFKSLFKITFCTGRPWPPKRTYQFHVNRRQISTHSYKMAFCVSGAELTNRKAKVNHKGWRTKNFIFISHCLAMVAGSVKKHAFFSNNPCYRSLTPNINNKEKFKLAWKWNLAKQFSSLFRIFKSLFEGHWLIFVFLGNLAQDSLESAEMITKL